MIYLLLAVLGGTMISVAMRLSEGRVQSRMCMIAINYLTCFVVTWGMSGFVAPFPQADGLTAALGMGTFNGFFYMLALILGQYNIATNGVILSSVFSKIGGLLIPLLVAILMFHEAPTAFQYAGFVLAIGSVLALNYQKGGSGIGGAFKLSLFALLIAEGGAGIMAKVFSEIGNPALASNFLMYTFATAFLFSGIIILLRRECPGRQELLYGMMIGIPNCISARLVLKALETVPAVIVYPFRSVATLVVISLVGVLLFKEKLSRRQVAAMGVILVSLALLNL